jgi:hypothetical protein
MLHDFNVLRKFGDSTIAIEAEYAANGAGDVIVVDVLGLARGAERTNISLLQDQPVDGHVIHAVTLRQPKVSGGSMMLHSIGSHYSVVARLAIGGQAVSVGPVPRKVSAFLMSLT